MTKDTNTTANNTQNQGGDQGAQGGGGSMLDVEKIKAGAQGAEGTQQQGGQDKTVEAGADGNPPQDKKGNATEPGQKTERPEWLKEDKFWDAEKGEVKIELMAKNLGELQKMVSKGDHKAPEKPEGYKVALDSKQKEILFGKADADPHQDPLFKQLTGWGVKNKISQAAMDEILGLYAEATAGEASKFQIDVKKERESLGKNADAIIQNQHEFFTQMYKNGEIGEAELKEASILFETAAGVKLIQALRSKYGEQAIPVDPNPNMDGVPSSEELGKMVVDEKYGKDKDFTAKVDGWYAKRYGSKPAMSSVAAR